MIVLDQILVMYRVLDIHNNYDGKSWNANKYTHNVHTDWVPAINNIVLVHVQIKCDSFCNKVWQLWLHYTAAVPVGWAHQRLHWQ